MSETTQDAPKQARTRGAKALAILVYTVLRVALFLVVWLLLELFTPLHGIWAAAAAILMSGAISVVLLDRQRGEVGSVAAGFFGRLNARIDASSAAEDVDEPYDTVIVPSVTDASGDGEGKPQHDAVDQQ